jgi:ABC-type glycerol-3-phosphate transport system permease component
MYLIVPMYFGGGLVPFYLLVNTLGLNNTYWALILPSVINIFYIIVFRNQINQLPQELLESAEMDGASEMRILLNIILPLVLPMAMAFVVFSAVAYWNEWFNVLIFIRDKSMWTLQFQLRDILSNARLIDEGTNQAMIKNGFQIDPNNLKMAALMLTVLPILVVYPFVQKYFIHGQLVGAVKG